MVKLPLDQKMKAASGSWHTGKMKNPEFLVICSSHDSLGVSMEKTKLNLQPFFFFNALCSSRVDLHCRSVVKNPPANVEAAVMQF